MTNFTEQENFISYNQFGFKKASSTTLAIHHFLSFVLNSFNNRHYTIVLYLDLKKAFDCVDIPILLQKLEHYGFRNDINNFFKHYFVNRKQYVNIGSENSSYRDIPVG